MDSRAVCASSGRTTLEKFGGSLLCDTDFATKNPSIRASRPRPTSVRNVPSDGTIVLRGY
jgi:hypothetical protein